MTGKELKLYRESVLKLSQAELGDFINGTSPRTVQGWERLPEIPKVVEFAVQSVKRIDALSTEVANLKMKIRLDRDFPNGIRSEGE